jgi:hypothetical protein
MASRARRPSYNAHIVDISFSLGEEKATESDTTKPKSQINSRKNSVDCSVDSSNERMSLDSLLSFALHMNSSHVAASVMKDQEDIFSHLENSSFMTNVVNLASLKRGLSEQQLREKMIEEIERARQRLLTGASCTAQNAQARLNKHSLSRATSDDVNSDCDEASDRDSDEESENFSNDSIGSYLDDLTAHIGGVGEEGMDAYYSARILESTSNVELPTTEQGQLIDKLEMMQVFSSLLEEDSEEEDNECDVRGNEVRRRGASESDDDTELAQIADYTKVQRSSSYFALSKSLQPKSPRRSDHDLHQLLADAQSRSPSRLPRTSYNAPLSSQPSLECSSLMCVVAEQYTSGEYDLFIIIFCCPFECYTWVGMLVWWYFQVLRYTIFNPSNYLIMLFYCFCVFKSMVLCRHHTHHRSTIPV